ncbi:MAG TPA: amidohydrolase family protein [Anaerolineales bacterium]|nr:amidohydrolase family protein [Anaerolineales bacterium]
MTQTADILLINAVVLTMDEKLALFEPGAVAVNGDSIVAVGPEAEIKTVFSAQEVVDCQRRVLMPGLINAHTHVPMTLLRGLADDLRLDVWLLGYMMPVEREFVSPEFVRLGTKLACAELIRSGVTTFNDMYYFEEEVAKATAEAGLRAVCGQTVLKFPSPDAESYEESLARAREFIDGWKNHPLIVPAIAPHAPYTCTEEILRSCAALAVEFDVPLHIHLSETALEVENSRNEHGIPVIPYVREHKIFDAKVIAAHCVHIDNGEMRTLKRYNAGIAHNPSSNLKLSSGVAPVVKMLELGLSVGIGTDGPSSNNDLDMFEEIRLTSFLAKGTSGDPTAVSAPLALTMATRLGARALHAGQWTGSIEAGKRADLILVDISPLHNSPRFQRDLAGAYAQVVFAAKSTDVTDVMVNGNWVMRDHQLLTLNEPELLAEAADYAKSIDFFLIKREQSVLSKLVAIGGAIQEESFEVQAKVRLPDPAPLLAALEKDEIEVLYTRHYREYDTYFRFDDPEQGYLRYREDEFIDTEGQVSNARYRLTLIGPIREREYLSDVMLSRSRFIAPASHSLRFYREYFKPASEILIEKDRLRWRIIFQDTTFYVNLDRVNKPDLGYFLEIKSRTWSRRDAEHKSALIAELVKFLSGKPEETVSDDYVKIVEKDT